MGIDLTFGLKAKLQNELAQLQYIGENANQLKEVFEALTEEKKIVSNILEKERISAVNNLILYKGIIKKLNTKKKRLSDKEQNVIQDINANSENIEDVSINDISFDVEFNSNINEITNTALSSINNSFDNLLSKEKVYNSDIKKEVVNIAFDVAGSAINEWYNAITDTIKRRQEVKDRLSKLSEYIRYMHNTIPQLYAYVSRAKEIALVLNKTNIVFSERYEKIYTDLYKDRTIFSKFNKTIGNVDINIRKDVKFLGQVCTEYNKINKTSKIEHR